MALGAERYLAVKVASSQTFAQEMPITSDLEKLVSLRDCGDLSQAEFEKAKERLLSGEVPRVSPSTERNQPPLPQGGKRKYILLVAILSTIAAALSGGAVVIGSSPIRLAAFALFTVAATLNWVEFSKRMRKE